MEQKFIQPTAEDSKRVEAQRDWVRGHYVPELQDNYRTVEGKLSLLQKILDSAWIEKSETWKLQSLGICFGDALSQKLSLEWVMVEDEHGRDPALRSPSTTVVIFPLTMISKRIERGEAVNVEELFHDVSQEVLRLTSNPGYRLQ